MNMTYCRYQNTLTDLRDCVSDLDQRTDGEADGYLSLEEFEAACEIVLQAQRLIALVAGRAAFSETMTSDEVREILTDIDLHSRDCIEGGPNIAL
jgi:hypothetical protein